MAKRPPSPSAEPVPESLRELFGANLRRERERQGVLQKDLAEAAGVSQGFLSLIESTGRNVTLDLAERLENGLDRAFVLWQTIRTPPLYDQSGIPHQYDVAVNSPATEENGANGLPGDVERHTWRKLGGVFAISLVQGLTGSLSSLGNSGNGTTNNIFPSFGQGASSAADIWLSKMINIPDVLTRLEGSQCGVLVLRDLNMKAAYRLVAQHGMH